MPPKNRTLLISLSLLSSILCTLSFEPYNFRHFIWIAFIPLLFVLNQILNDKKKFRRAFKYGYFCGLIHWLTSIYFFYKISIVAYLALSAYLALYYGVFSIVAVYFLKNQKKTPFVSLKNAFLLASAWTSLEWIRATILTGFAWNHLTVALADNYEVLLQITDIIGSIGFSFIIFFCNAVFLAVLIRMFDNAKKSLLFAFKPQIDFHIAILLIISCLLYGINKIKSLKQKMIKNKNFIEISAIAIQPNLDREDKWKPELLPYHIQALEALTIPHVLNNLNQKTPDLIIWPESAIPTHLHNATQWLSEIVKVTKKTHVFGVNQYNRDFTKIYNSMVLVNAQDGTIADMQSYFKIHLVPFGEFLPLRSIIKFIKYIAPQMPLGADFSRGTSYETLKAKINSKNFEIIPLVCFEDNVSHIARKFCKENTPQLMINLTNDSWFGNTPIVTQHFANAKMRSFELCRPLFRSCNNGVTGYIDQFGFTQNTFTDPENSSPFIAGTFKHNFILNTKPTLTFFAKYGNIFSVTLLAIIFLSGIYTSTKKILK